MASPSDPFLERIIGILSRVKDETDRRGYLTVGTLVEMARSQAEDELRTQGKAIERLREFKANGRQAPNP
jgi:hypothetical protein